jgi:ribose 5-phosphate isomerase B
MKIVIANDHRGVELKNKLLSFLKEEGYSVYNVGTDTLDSVDYPIYAKELSKHLEMDDLGILICGTGIGMSIAANKIKGIRCAKANTIDEAKMTRMDNDANVLALSSEMEVSEVKKIVNVFLKTEVSMDERHIRRRKMLEALEDER